MGDEAVDGSKMGTKLIFFVAIIGLALVAFIVGKSLVNTGVDGLEQSVQSVNDSRYSDYNGKVVRGRAVKSAIENFANEEVAVVVATLNCADSPTGVGTRMPRTCTVKVNGATMKDNSGASKDIVGIGYNALLAQPGQAATITAKDGKAIYDGDFAVDNSGAGSILYNLDTTNLNKKGTFEYIADNASFNAKLIQNSAGEICGIVFIQKKLS